MAKNLIDDSTFEFVEGAEKTDHEALEERVSTTEELITQEFDEIGTLSGKMQTAENDIDTLEDDVTALISALQGVSNNLNLHTGNSNIHLSAAEKQYLSEPYVVGHYSGMGQASRNINLGFTPALVIVFCTGLPLVVYDASVTGNKVKAYSGCATWTSDGDNHSLGIQVVQNGFAVSQDTTTGAALNESGTGYFYMAFRKLS